MKKLIIAAIAVAFSVVANAATVKWQVTNVQSSPDVAVTAGWAVQIYASTVAFDIQKAITGELTTWATGATTATGTTTITYRATGNGTQANDTTASYYMVIYDDASVANAKNYIVSAVKSVTTNAAGSDVSASFGNMSGTGSTNTFLSSSWTAVPEPTSGLLMLLGMAGLALRRRRA